MASQPTVYNAALYLRLSKDDEGEKESASISTQRKMLTAYAKEHGYFVFDVYIDDGYSGTNFDRPAFNRMIHDINSGKINMVITKDLSRLGRDYITAGQYTELFFPGKGVRFIAVNDGYDSESPYNDIAPFKHVINEMYARDTSKKIRSAFLTKMQSGSYIGSYAPYGYQKSPEDQNRLVVDPSAAQIVCRIFQMAGQGSRPADIAKELNEKQIPSPAVYRCQKNPNLKIENYSKRQEWTPATIGKILRNEIYLGNMVQGKTRKLSFKSKATIEKPKEDWVVVQNTHEPIVSKDTFRLVQQRIASRTNHPEGDFHNLFSGIAKCMDCGRNMSTTISRRKGRTYNLCCGGYKLYGTRECSNHFIDYQTLYALILEQVRRQIYLTEEQRTLLIGAFQEKNIAGGLYEQADKQLVDLKRRITQVDRVVQRLYEDRVSEKISEERFDRLLEQYESEQKELKRNLAGQLQCLEKMSAKNDGARADEKLEEKITEYEKISHLTTELLYQLIDRIEVGQGFYEETIEGRVRRQEIKIYYRFSNNQTEKRSPNT